MSGWVKIPVDWFDRDDVEEMGAEGVALFLSALAYSARHTTDGFIPARQVRRLWPAPAGQVKRLVEAGWWEAHQGGWYIPDWKTFILSSDEVEKRREDSRVSSERLRRHQRGDHAMCTRCQYTKRSDASRDQSPDTSQGESLTALRTVPSPTPDRTDSVPTPREGRSRDEDGEAGDVGSATSAGAPSAQPPPQPEGEEEPPPPSTARRCRGRACNQWHTNPDSLFCDSCLDRARSAS